MDKISKESRSRNMSLIRAKNTEPELLVRKELFRLGLRYRIHYPLPGKPDITFPLKKMVIFIHGCFWHGHGCKFDHIPKSNESFWFAKMTKNKERDSQQKIELTKKGWKVITLWECEIRTSLQNSLKQITDNL